MWLATGDLRLSDNPALTRAAMSGEVICLFILDNILLTNGKIGINRLSFLFESLHDLRDGLHKIGSELFVRRGDWESEVILTVRKAKVSEVHILQNFSAYARARYVSLEKALAKEGVSLVAHPGTAIVEPGVCSPKVGDKYFKVFTPYYRVWENTPRRPLLPPVDWLGTDFDQDPGHIPDVGWATEKLSSSLNGNPFFSDSAVGKERKKFLLLLSPNKDLGGELTAKEKLRRFITSGALSGYSEGANDLAAGRTSRLSPYLHFGCISPLEIERTLIKSYPSAQNMSTNLLRQNSPKTAVENDGYPAPDPESGASRDSDVILSVTSFIRQLCWRDFYIQFAWGFPNIQSMSYRERPVTWNDDETALLSWMNGETGEDIVDAAMAQLADEGFVHNRARLIASSYLTKTLQIDWRRGLSHYNSLLTDADYASNAGNWQWMAGVGTDTRPNRTLSPKRQQERFDPNGTYRARYLAGFRGDKNTDRSDSKSTQEHQQRLF